MMHNSLKPHIGILIDFFFLFLLINRMWDYNECKEIFSIMSSPKY